MMKRRKSEMMRAKKVRWDTFSWKCGSIAGRFSPSGSSREAGGILMSDWIIKLSQKHFRSLSHDLATWSRWMCAAPPPPPRLSAEDGSMLTMFTHCREPGSSLSPGGAAGMWHSAGFCVCLSNENENLKQQNKRPKTNKPNKNKKNFPSIREGRDLKDAFFKNSIH